MAGILNGSLLASGTDLPGDVDYAYYPDVAVPDGKPVVRSEGENKYRFRAIASKAGPGGATKATTLNGPKFINKAWVSSPLPQDWRINADALTYEKTNSDGTVLTSTIFRPFPPAIASPELGSAVMLRRYFELSIINPAGKDDSNSYLSLVEVKVRDRQFNTFFGLPIERPWLAAEKILAGGDAGDEWEIEDARQTAEAAAGAGALAGAANAASVCLDRLEYWGRVGGGILNGAPTNEVIINSFGNHVPVSNWHSQSIKNQTEDAISVIECVGDVKYNIEYDDGVFHAVPSQEDVLCCELQHRENNKGSRKLAKGSPVSGKFFKAEVKALVVATAPIANNPRESRSPPEETPRCLVYGLRLMADHVKISKPRKRRKVSEYKEMRAINEAMRKIITKKNFEDLMAKCIDLDACCDEAEAFIGDVAAQELSRSIPGLAGGAAFNLAKKKMYGSLVFDAFNAEEEEAD